MPHGMSTAITKFADRGGFFGESMPHAVKCGRGDKDGARYFSTNHMFFFKLVCLILF
ncbi:hypothetical protein HanRHA438_Chr01g0026461 [Helianthus annuus]|nr:hypothetical protein HanRHA438_Chr01g0026461 [Helianthus annuus]